MKKLNITFCSIPDFSSNAKPLYKYMKKRYKDKMNFVWVVRTNEMYEKLKKKNIKVYKLYSKSYYNYIKKSDIIISTHGDLMFDKPEGSLYIELWHGTSPKKIGYLLDNFSEFDIEFLSTLSRKVDYMIVPSEFWSYLFSVIFHVDKKRVLTLGYAKFDEFINKNPKQDLSKVLGIDAFKYKKIIYYTPTFKKGIGRDLESNVNVKNLIDLKEYDEDILIKYLQKNNYLLCIKNHPSDEVDYFVFENDNIKIIKDEKLLEKGITINEILGAADVLISDFSSMAIEFTFFNKPVICLDTDVENYSKNRGIIFDDFDFWTLGLKSNNIASLLENIDKAFNNFNANENKYKSKRDLWIGNHQDGGCKQICDFLFDGNQISKKAIYNENQEDVLARELKIKNDIIQRQAEELTMIKNSRSWKLFEKIRKIRKKRQK